MVIKAVSKAVLLAAIAMCCRGQQADIAGIENPWDVRTILTNLSQDTSQLKTLLDGLRPQQWSEKGAPSTYILQFQTAGRQVNDVIATTKLLTQKTDSLALSLDDYFRLEALDVTTRSLEDGARKYGERSSADKLSQLIARNFNNRERFREYIRNLAATTEQNFKIADEEAQRCRAMISKEPAPGSKRLRK